MQHDCQEDYHLDVDLTGGGRRPHRDPVGRRVNDQAQGCGPRNATRKEKEIKRIQEP